MKAIVVTDRAAGTAGMKLSERPEPAAAINDVVVQVHAFVRELREQEESRRRFALRTPRIELNHARRYYA